MGPAALLGLQQYLAFVRAPFPTDQVAAVRSYAAPSGQDATVAYAYSGGVFSPLQVRSGTPFEPVSFVLVVDHFVVIVVFCVLMLWGRTTTTQNAVVFVPHVQASPANTHWHVYDCSTGLVVTYAAPTGADAAVNQAYYGGVFSPSQVRAGTPFEPVSFVLVV